MNMKFNRAKVGCSKILTTNIYIQGIIENTNELLIKHQVPSKSICVVDFHLFCLLFQSINKNETDT